MAGQVRWLREAWEVDGFEDEEATGDHHHRGQPVDVSTFSAQEEATPLPYSPTPHLRLTNSFLQIKL